MPTVLQVDGFRFVIYLPPREHAPAHVHAFKAGTLAKIQLVPVRLIKIVEMKDTDVRAAVRIVDENLETFLSAWRKIHGD